MKALIYILLFGGSLLSLPCFSQGSGEQSFTIKGHIKGLKNDSIILFINNQDKDGNRKEPDTIITTAKDDVFNIKGTTFAVRNVWAYAGGFKSRRSFSFYLEKGTTIIEGNVDSLSNLSFTGTPANNDQTRARKVTNDIYSRILLLRTKQKEFENDSEEYKKIIAAMNIKYDSIQSYELDFIKSNPQSYVSGAFLYVKQDKLELQELERLYNSLAPGVKNGWYGEIVRDKIKARKFVAIGQPAPEFSSKDTSGNTVHLSDFRGKYVLLEYWANWCVPCRGQSPHLVKMYEKFKDKGFTILQYSMDDANAAAKWKAAIIKDKLVWTQISDLNGFESKVSKLYGVQPIPDNFLIDPKGIIIGRRMEGKELEEKLKELLQ